MRTLIIGSGQIGKALAEVLSPYYEVRVTDRDIIEYSPKILHICFPFSEEFSKEVKRYQGIYKPRITVIHSTVPVGTSEAVGACHSPVRGHHPYLAKSLKTFHKFVGGKDADEVVEYLRKAEMKPVLCRDSKTTELGKILCTTFYAACIEYIKEAERVCMEYGVPFSEAFTLFQQTYNEGYEKMGFPEYRRPILQPIQQKQGGHCTLPNLEFLNTEFSKLIKKLNAGS